MLYSKWNSRTQIKPVKLQSNSQTHINSPIKLDQAPIKLGQISLAPIRQDQRAPIKQDPRALIVPVKHRLFHNRRSSTNLSLCWFVRVGLFVYECVCVSLYWFACVDVFVYGCVCEHLRKKKIRRGEGSYWVCCARRRETKKVQTWN